MLCHYSVFLAGMTKDQQGGGRTRQPGSGGGQGRGLGSGLSWRQAAWSQLGDGRGAFRGDRPEVGGMVDGKVSTGRHSHTPLARSQVCYLPSRGDLQTFALRDVRGPLRAKLAVLRLLACYMQRRLREVRSGRAGLAMDGRRGTGGPDLARPQEGTASEPTPPAAPSLCLLRFITAPQALLLLLSDGTLQVRGGGPGKHLTPANNNNNNN
jgi:hypothetical protein